MSRLSKSLYHVQTTELWKQLRVLKNGGQFPAFTNHPIGTKIV